MEITKIKMKPACGSSYSLLEIDQVYVTGCKNEGFFPKANIHDYLKEHPNSIQVGIYPYPDVKPAISQNGEKYVKSEPNSSGFDNLLNLPRV